MRDWKNNPIVIATLLIILVGAIAVTIIRIKGPNVQVARALVTRSGSTTGKVDAGQPHLVGLIPRPTRRDPFYHQVLFTERKMKAGSIGSPRLPVGGSGDWSSIPITINGIEPIQGGPATANQNSGTQQPADEPKLVLNAIVSGTSPLAVIKDGTEQTYFVRSGDRFGDAYIVVRVGTSDITVQHGGKQLILKLEGGQETNEKT